MSTPSATTATDSQQPDLQAHSQHRHYHLQRKLKYGVNPQQSPAFILSIDDKKLPFEVLNGTPGYINLLDALNAWQLVSELKQATGLAAAASFKHVSPAGVGVAVPLSDDLAEIYDVVDPATGKQQQLSPQALAYLRARQADPLCSFGDFAAISDVVDEQTALFLKREVSDGIIAPGYDAKALEILKQKKNGSYIILQADPHYEPPTIEYREIYGVVFAQARNSIQLSAQQFSDEKIVTTQTQKLSEAAVRDLLIASICIKYTQSNSVAYALDGQAIGIGAGQQSRVDCVKLAGSKVEKWWLRQHPKVRALKFKPELKRQDRVNARIAYIEGNLTTQENEAFQAQLQSPPEELTEAEKHEWVTHLKGVSLSSDAFFPFRDNIDQSSKRGVQYIAQPGGSVQDSAVIQAANEYGMTMVFTGIRLFHH